MIRWDTRIKRWRFAFDCNVSGGRAQARRLLPRGWSQAQADAHDRQESGRLWVVATGIGQRDPLIDEAVAFYLRDNTALKSFKATAEHLAAIAWAYMGKPMTALPAVAHLVTDTAETAPATVRNRLACLKAAARWAWKKHILVAADPTARMQMPPARNERHIYATRRQMLKPCRACNHWQVQIALRVAFYLSMGLKLYRVEHRAGVLILADTKNGDRRAVPMHPEIAHLVRLLPLTAPKITIQRAWQRARAAAEMGHLHFSDLPHSAASEMEKAGVDLFTAGRVLGHRDAHSTARYSRLRTDALAAAVGKIGKKRA